MAFDFPFSFAAPFCPNEFYDSLAHGGLSGKRLGSLTKVDFIHIFPNYIAWICSGHISLKKTPVDNKLCHLKFRTAFTIQLI